MPANMITRNPAPDASPVRSPGPGAVASLAAGVIVGGVMGVMQRIGRAQNVPSDGMTVAGTIALSKFPVELLCDGRDVARAVYEAMEQARIDELAQATGDDNGNRNNGTSQAHQPPGVGGELDQRDDR